jgi:leucyl/phenylalanyl-tRNA--protein transferase
MANKKLKKFLEQQKLQYFPNPLDLEWSIGLHTDYLNVDILSEAYLNGYFPWPDSSDSTVIQWANPLNRGVMVVENANIPKSVAKIVKRKEFYLKIDTAFSEVIENCSQRIDGEDTWITNSIKEEYIKFHQAGWAHSFEAYDSETCQLVGGLYGVSVGQVFCGESMFYRKSGASKFALAKLIEILKKLNVLVLDTQMVTSVMENFGASYVDREDYLNVFYQLRNKPISTEEFRQAASELDE